MSNLDAGEVVPIPTLPAAVTETLSVPFVNMLKGWLLSVPILPPAGLDVAYIPILTSLEAPPVNLAKNPFAAFNTCNLYAGEVVPIPTEPDSKNVTLLVLLVLLKRFKLLIDGSKYNCHLLVPLFLYWSCCDVTPLTLFKTTDAFPLIPISPPAVTLLENVAAPVVLLNAKSSTQLIVLPAVPIGATWNLRVPAFEILAA